MEAIEAPPTGHVNRFPQVTIGQCAIFIEKHCEATGRTHVSGGQGLGPLGPMGRIGVPCAAAAEASDSSQPDGVKARF